jgi:hypothetical protein
VPHHTVLPNTPSHGVSCASASGATLGARSKRCEHLGEVATDLGTDLRAHGFGGRPGDLHPIGDARPLVADVLHPVCRADDEVATLCLVDEQLGLDGFGDPQLDSSSPGGVIRIVLPTANGPRSSIRSTPAFHSGQRSTPAQSRQTARAVALVSTLCSTAHTRPTLVPTLGHPPDADGTRIRAF